MPRAKPPTGRNFPASKAYLRCNRKEPFMFKMLTFAAFGGLGYAAYSFYQKNGKVPNVTELLDTVKTLTGPQIAKAKALSE